jgi:hypothetical protein
MFGISRNKQQSLGFKETSKEFRKQIKIARKIKKDPAKRLAKYQALKPDIDSVFTDADKDIQRAAEKTDSKKDGLIAYSQSPGFIVVGLFGGVIWPPIYSVAALAPLIPVLLLGGIALTGAFMMGCRHMLFRSRSKELGMTVKDVKYAQRIKVQQTKVDRSIKAMTEFNAEQPEKKKLDALRAKYAASTARTKPQKNPPAQVNTPVAQSASPAAV